MTSIADNDGIGIAWERRPATGDGPTTTPVVLVHGLGYARWGWDGLPERLTAAGFDLVLLDNRGIGDSDVPEGPYTATQMATDVVAVLDDAGIDTAHVVGSSLGGMVAQEVALGWPERVDRLVLLSTTPGGEDAAPMPQGTVDLLAAMPGMEPVEALRAAITNALAPAWADERPELVEQILRHRLAAPQDPAGWQAQAHAGTTHDGGGRLGSITAPTLVLHGDRDVVVDPANGPLLAGRIPDARLVVLEGHGHLPFWEDPDAVARSIVGFLAGTA